MKPFKTKTPAPLPWTRRIGLALCLLIVTGLAQSQSTLPADIQSAAKRLVLDFELKSDASCLVVSVAGQRLYLVRGDTLFASFPVSTSSVGTGSAAGSNRTPLGVHRIASKFGHGAPLATIFKARRSTGRLATIYHDSTDVEEDLVTTRILWLRGLEPGSNSGPGIDSYKRYIYIHGTNEEGRIGRPASHGCVRMKNEDVITLFDCVETGTLVNIIQ